MFAEHLFLCSFQAFATITERDQEIAQLKAKLVISEAKRRGFTEEDDEDEEEEKLRRKKCAGCKKLLEENKKLKEKEEKMDRCLILLQDEWKKVQMQGVEYDEANEKIDSLKEALKESQEKIKEMEKDMEDQKYEIDKGKLEVEMLEKEADESRQEAEEKEAEAEKYRLEAEEAKAAKLAMEEEVCRKDEAIERCARENMILREKLETDFRPPTLGQNVPNQEIANLRVKFRETEGSI